MKLITLDKCEFCNVSNEEKNLSETVTYNVSSLNSTEFYIYEYVYEEFQLPLDEIIPVAFVYGMTLILGIVGNVLVIFSVMRFQRMKTITNTFLVSLASADLLVIIVCIPTKFAGFFSFSWQLGEFLCKSVHYIQNVSAICSVTTLTAMSLERYYAILHPVKAKYVCTVGRAKRVIGILWLMSFVLASPIIVGREHMEVGRTRKAYWCKKNWSPALLSIIYELYMLLIILIIPVTVMSFAYFNICMELWYIVSPQCKQNNGQSKSEFGHGTSSVDNVSTPRKSKDDNNSKKQVIKMLVAIILIFIVCWAPLLINNVLVGFELLPDLHLGHHKHIRETFHIMAYANSCVNPVVYTFMSRNFKETFRQTLCGCFRRRRYNRKNTLETKTSCARTGSTNCDTTLIANRHAVELSNCHYGTTGDAV